MRTKKAIVSLLALPWVVSGCATSEYLTDRRHDLTDAAHVDFNDFALGTAVSVGPMVLGGHAITTFIDRGTSFRLGLGGVQEIKTSGIHWGVGFPFERYQATKRPEGGPFGDWRLDRSSSFGDYEHSYPGWGSLGFDIGLLWGVGARVDAVELLDFAVGLTRIDLLRDDQEAWRHKLTGTAVRIIHPPGECPNGRRIDWSPKRAAHFLRGIGASVDLVSQEEWENVERVGRIYYLKGYEEQAAIVTDLVDWIELLTPVEGDWSPTDGHQLALWFAGRCGLHYCRYCWGSRRRAQRGENQGR